MITSTTAGSSGGKITREDKAIGASLGEGSFELSFQLPRIFLRLLQV